MAFGDSVGATLARLSPAQKAWAKIKIQEVLYNAEFEQSFSSGTDMEWCRQLNLFSSFLIIYNNCIYLCSYSYMVSLPR